jgi:hypothetical protein
VTTSFSSIMHVEIGSIAEQKLKVGYEIALENLSSGSHMTRIATADIVNPKQHNL